MIGIYKNYNISSIGGCAELHSQDNEWARNCEGSCPFCYNNSIEVAGNA